MFGSRRKVLTTIALSPALMLATQSTLAQSARQMQEGKDFRLVSPAQPVESGNKIEVESSFSTRARTACPTTRPCEWKRLFQRCRYRRVPFHGTTECPPRRTYYRSSIGKTTSCIKGV